MEVWHAKPSGGYLLSSPEAEDNMLCIYDCFEPEGYTIEAIAGIIGNMNNESAMNPWRWQGDSVSMSAGYGLIQFTPASDYINLTGVPYHSPNLSVSIQTAGATPQDGNAQCSVIYNDTLSKWQDNIWRNYWNPSSYPMEYAYMEELRTRYGRYIDMNTFKSMTNYEDATFIFNGGYVGELILNFEPRRRDAFTAYAFLLEHAKKRRKKFPIIYYLRNSL